jgi:antitoxin component YwqK of YwqJK toxin-antitoxin module
LHGAKLAKHINLQFFFNMKKIKQTQVFFIAVPPEGDFEDYRDKNRITHQKMLYDQNENLLENIEFDDYGNETGKSVFKYDDKGRLIEKESYDETGEREEKQSFEHDESGKLLRSFIHFLDDTTDTIEYHYNSKGHLTEKITINDENELEAVHKFEYSGDKIISEELAEYGEIIEKKGMKYNVQGKLIEGLMWNTEEEYRIVNEYDDRGNLVKSLKYDDNNKLISKQLAQYDEKNRLIERVEEESTETRTISVAYNEDGTAFERHTGKSGGSKTFSIERDYDEAGFMIEVRITVFGMDEKPQRKYIHAYAHDFF